MDEEYRCRCGVVLDRDGYNGRDDETMGGQYIEYFICVKCGAKYLRVEGDDHVCLIPEEEHET